MTRLLITGSREWPDKEWIYKCLDAFLDDDLVIIHGACPSGADKHADDWAKEHGVEVEAYPADWKTYGRAAGPIRNQHMVAQGADLCLGFPWLGSRGSWDCMNRAAEAGIMVVNMGEHYDK